MGKGGGGGGYVSPHIGQYENDTYQAIQNRLGAYGTSGAGAYNYGGGGGTVYPSYSGGTTYPSTSTGGTFSGGTLRQTATAPTTTDPYSKIGVTRPQTGLYNPAFSNTNPRGTFAPTGPAPLPEGNLSQAGAPLGGPAGIRTATAGYDFNPLDQAISKLGQGPQTYNPFQFNFGELPAEYTSKAYQAGASDINKAGSDQLAKLQEATGTRRPGLLMQEAQQSQRDTGKNLAGLNTQLQLNQVNQNLALQQAQQQAQAAQNLGANQTNNQNILNYLNALNQAATGKIGTQAGLVSGEREYQDKALQYLMQLYQGATGAANQAAALNQSNQNSVLGLLGGIGGSIFGGPIGGAIGKGIGSLF